jgi:hypothetical protein
LTSWQLELAAHAWRQLAAAGCRVLNDPARVLQRLPLLRALHNAGLNSFRAWSAHDAAAVDRFPVFVRTMAGHRGNLTDLLPDRAMLEEALARLVAEGYPMSDLMVAEYRAAPVRQGLFRKMAACNIGGCIVPVASVHEAHWTAKEGQDGIAGVEGYAEDLALMRANPHAATLRRAFEIARIDYGRADYGVVDGRAEVYEINTNPMIHPPKGHAFADRAEALRLTHEGYRTALAALDAPGKGWDMVRLRPAPWIAESRLRDRILPGYQWMP